MRDKYKRIYGKGIEAKKMTLIRSLLDEMW